MALGVKKYRKKPVVIEAVQLPPVTMAAEQPVAYMDQVHAIARWCEAQTYAITKEQSENPLLAITTLEGTMEAMPGDWIIKGVKGEFYPCKPDIFEATYEAAQEGEW
jgi:hypothetical protein